MRSFVATLLAAALAAAAFPARAELSAEELAKLAQNPVGNLISLPFQNNTNLNYGPHKGTRNILNIQHNFPGGFYLTSAPIATVDWKADRGNRNNFV